MPKAADPQFIIAPSDKEVRARFEEYTLAVGKVAHAWNYFQEKLAELFSTVSRAQRGFALAVWYSSENDRTQRNMLRAAIVAALPERWPAKYTAAKDDLIDLLKRADTLAERRNDAIHAPCTLLTDAGGTEIAASFVSGHTRAKNLRGKEILVEFDWCERYTEELSRFVIAAERALSFEQIPWPSRPRAPDRNPKKALQGQPRQSRPK